MRRDDDRPREALVAARLDASRPLADLGGLGTVKHHGDVVPRMLRFENLLDP